MKHMENSDTGLFTGGSVDSWNDINQQHPKLVMHMCGVFSKQYQMRFNRNREQAVTKRFSACEFVNILLLKVILQY